VNLKTEIYIIVEINFSDFIETNTAGTRLLHNTLPHYTNTHTHLTTSLTRAHPLTTCTHTDFMLTHSLHAHTHFFTEIFLNQLFKVLFIFSSSTDAFTSL
jgi:hypothetical protein